MINFREPIYYLSMDFYQGLPGFWLFPNYHLVVYHYHPAMENLPFRKRIFSLSDKLGKHERVPRNSGHLLAHPLVQNFINHHANSRQPRVAYFKPSLKIDMILAKKHWFGVGNPAALAHKLEDKIYFWQLLKKQKWPFAIAGLTAELGKLNYKQLVKRLRGPFVLQLRQGWAGRTTFLVKTAKQFNQLQHKMPKKRVKITKFIDGLTVTNNAVVTIGGQVLQSFPAWQLTGQRSLCGLGKEMATCGRVWQEDFDHAVKEQIFIITRKVGSLLARENFRGFFGLDFLVGKNGLVYLQELNPRLTASAAFYTLMELKAQASPLLAYHYQAFLNFHLPPGGQPLSLVGGEIVQRQRQMGKFVVNEPPASGNYNTNGEINSREFLPRKGSVTFIGPAAGEKINFHQELFKISAPEAMVQTSGNRIRINVKYWQWLKFFRQRVQ